MYQKGKTLDVVVKERPWNKRLLAAFGVSGCLLGAAISVQDNVHFGDTHLHNPVGNHYVVGAHSKTTISGMGIGKISTYGLLHAETRLASGSEHTGRLSTVGLLTARNSLGAGSSVHGYIVTEGAVYAENLYDKSSGIDGWAGAVSLLISADADPSRSHYVARMGAFALDCNVDIDSSFQLCVSDVCTLRDDIPRHITGMVSIIVEGFYVPLLPY